VSIWGRDEEDASGGWRDFLCRTRAFRSETQHGRSIYGNSGPAAVCRRRQAGASGGLPAIGKWPDKTMFVLEIYGSTSQGSINKHGSYQTEFMGLDVEVKDERRFPDKWAYFNFEGATQTAASFTPSRNDCWNCHDQHAAVEHSFVQFYPELLKVAHAKGTLKPGVQLEAK
jgi:Cytochrome P460